MLQQVAESLGYQKPPTGEQAMSGQPERLEQQRHVQVWFGQHVIASYKAEPALAARYATAMARRFAGLRVTNEAVPVPAAALPPLPGERLWDVTPS